MNMFAKAATFIAALAAGVSAPAAGNAQSYPTKPISIVLPVAAGGGTDIVVRVIAHKLTPLLKQQFIIQNRPGAGGNIAADYVARSAPDGYTLLAVTASHAVNPSLYKTMSYDPIRDFAPIAQLTSQPYLVVVPPHVPAKTIPEFVAWAKSRPEGITYASSGSGLLGHLGMEMLKLKGGFKGQHVPYKGAGPALIDTIAGRVDVFLPTVVSGAQPVKDGSVRIIGVTGRDRVQVFPEVPTVAEQGYKDFEVTGWYGLLAPAGTPPEIVTLLNTHIRAILKEADMRERIASDGAEPVGSAPEAFDKLIRAEKERWAEVVRLSGAATN